MQLYDGISIAGSNSCWCRWKCLQAILLYPSWKVIACHADEVKSMYNSREAAAQMAQREIVGTTFVPARVEDILYHAWHSVHTYIISIACSSFDLCLN